jgi:chemotaxis protein methyltransferase CheR
VAAEDAMIEPTDADIDALLAMIFARYQYDFRRYARASLRRRLGQALDRFAVGSMDELVELIRGDSHAFTRLLSLLTIQVSDLFRDPSYFRTFRDHVVPVLRTYPSRRLWVAGCSTGEEAYSFAIVLREEGLAARTRIYATDIHADSLRIAEAAIYPIDRLRAFTENHRDSGARCSLSDHYVAAYGGAAFDRGLRDMIVFADHSLATDTVFAEVQAVSCRNVLIYFDRTLQDRALGLFRDALVRRGFLGLGPKESIQFSPLGAWFEPVSSVDRWYRKVEEAR